MLLSRERLELPSHHGFDSKSSNIPHLKRPLLLAAAVCVCLVCVVMSVSLEGVLTAAFCISAAVAVSGVLLSACFHRADFVLLGFIVVAVLVRSAYVRVSGPEKMSGDFLDKNHVSETDDADEDDVVTVDYSGIVTEVNPGSNYAYYTVKLTSPLNVSAKLSCYGARGVGIGDTVEGKAKVLRPEKVKSNGYFEERTLKADGIFMKLEADGSVNVARKAEKSGMALLRDRVKRELLRYCAVSDDLVPYYIAVGMFTGDKSGMPTEIKNDFRRCGLSHILSVSGLHLSVLVLLAGYILSAVKLPRFLRCVLLTAFIFGYAAFTGFGMPVVRSAVMAFAVNFGVIIGRKSDPLTSLSAAVFAVLLISPYSMYDSGAALSFLSTAGILFCAPLYGKCALGRNVVLRIFGYVASTIVTTLAAVAFSLPVLIFTFGEVSLMSPIANVAAALPVTVILTFVFLISVLSLMPLGVCRSVCAILGLAVKLTANFLVKTSHFLASHRFSAVNVPEKSVVFVIASAAIVVICIVLAAYLRRNHAAVPAVCAVGACVACCALFGLSAVRDFARPAAFVTYDKNGGYLSLRSEGEFMCISTGAKDANHGAKSEDICDFYSGKNVYAVAERGDLDVLRELRCIENFERRYGTERILLPKSINAADAKLYRELEGKLRDRGFTVEYYAKGEISFGSFDLRFYPQADGYEAAVRSGGKDILAFLSYDRYRSGETSFIPDGVPVFLYSSKKKTKDFGGIISSAERDVYVMNLTSEYGKHLEKGIPYKIYCDR